MISIYVESLEVYAKINYLRDKCTKVDGEPLISEPWKEVKEEYMIEAEMDKEIVLTLDEIDSILENIK